jgi:hypothetical protein
MLSQLRALLFCDFLLVSTWLHIVQLHVQARPQKAESYRLPDHEHDSKSAEEKVEIIVLKHERIATQNDSCRPTKLDIPRHSKLFI